MFLPVATLPANTKLYIENIRIIMKNIKIGLVPLPSFTTSYTGATRLPVATETQ
jgi:hypothetical protein